MSNVNQAFLRAYVKSRSETGSLTDAPSAPAVSPTHVSGASTQPPTQLRIDPPAKTNTLAHATNTQARAAAPRIEPVPRTEPVPGPASKLGVWSALGVERGMKGSVANNPAPAVVRNGVQPVPMEATQQRRSQAPIAPPKQPNTATNSSVPSPSLELLSDAWTKKRAPALKDLKPREPATVAPAPSLPTPTHAPGVQRRVDVPIHAAQTRELAPPPARPAVSPTASPAVSPAAFKPVVPPFQKRADLPAARAVSGPHALPTAATAAPPPAATAPATTAPATTQRTASDPIASRTSASKPIDKQRLQELPLPVAFAPSWEVDTFFWPEVIVRLEEANPGAFRQTGHHLANANQSGLKVMAVTSGERGVGRSTVALHMARAAANAGLKVALVDADAFNPSLVDQLRLDIQHGWQDCLFEAVPLEEVAVHSISDRITLFPLTGVVSQQQVHANLHRMSKLIRRISTAFDIVLLDSCRLNLDQRDLIGVSNESVIDAAVVVVDTELSIKEKIDSAISILQSMGMTSIGLIENFRS